MKARVLLFPVATLGMIFTHSSQASTLYIGSIAGIFTNPVLTGNIIPVGGGLTFLDSTFANQPANTPFPLGTFQFLNGTSALNSLVFGVTLNLSFSDSAAVTPGTSKLNIVTTANGGVDKFADADFVGFDKFPCRSPLGLKRSKYS